MEFFLDANVPYSSAKIIKNLGYKVRHAREIGMGKSPDEEIIDYASRNNMILITRDVGFGNLINYPLKSHKGVVLLRLPPYFISRQINKIILDFLKSVKEKEIKNSLIVLDINKYRVRKK
ncbi:MAG: DUF5615 family PIN-like protein [Nanoarchaeota archaeon]|nr:DUF5615 family PIN-like protein [Nanoarchaeota archaeon]